MATAKKGKSYTVRNSPIHGRGVFATKKIRKGTVIVEYKGRRTSYEKAVSRPDSDPGDSAHTFLFELDDGRVIDASVRGNSARWINHSCDPNCATFEDEDGRVFVEARRCENPARRRARLRLQAECRRPAHPAGACGIRLPVRHRQVPGIVARRQSGKVQQALVARPADDLHDCGPGDAKPMRPRAVRQVGFGRKLPRGVGIQGQQHPVHLLPPAMRRWGPAGPPIVSQEHVHKVCQ